MNTASLLPAQFELDTPHDPLLQATIELERVAKFLDLEDWIVERLRHCEQETVVNFLLAGDDGRAHPVTGICVRHCTANGPVAVPFAISREAYRNSVCAEAIRMSWLCALYGLRYGGGAAALVLDPQKHSEHELQRGIRQFGLSAAEVLRDAGMMMPNAAAHSIEMDWLESGLEERGPLSRSIVAGKASSANRATSGQEFAAGVAELIRCSAGNLKQKVAVQGFSHEIQGLLVHLHRHGARIVAVADESGGLAHELGLDPNQLVEHVRRHGVLLGYPDGTAALNADVLASDCDVLILAGGEQQITGQNASGVRARVILEMKAGAVTASGAHELGGTEKVLVNSLLCAGPDVLRSAADMNAQVSPGRRMAWIRRSVAATWRAVKESATNWNVGVSEAAMALAIQRVAAILRAQRAPSSL